MARISALIYRVNDYLREPAGDPSAVDARSLLIETALRLCGRNILRDDGEPKPAIVFIDPVRLRSILENIIRNALESGSAEEEIGASIEKAEKKHGNGRDFVVISVFDQGKGAQDIKRAFDPFYTTKSTGTGIGLSICKRFAEAAGGGASLENREGGGVKITIILPEYAPDAFL